MQTEILLLLLLGCLILGLQEEEEQYKENFLYEKNPFLLRILSLSLSLLLLQLQEKKNSGCRVSNLF
jgi:hypothetical protein